MSSLKISYVNHKQATTPFSELKVGDVFYWPQYEVDCIKLDRNAFLELRSYTKYNPDDINFKILPSVVSTLTIKY